VGLIDRVGPGRLAIDTSVFIYFIERHPTFRDEVAPLFEQADAGERELVTSSLTLLELLVVPFRTGDRRLADRYEALLTRSRGVTMVDLTRDHLKAAAHLRAVSSVRTPDAVQLAVALASHCSAFVTNDRRLPAVPGLRIVDLAGG
jgi:predicted nucleic acid-binding protein